MKILAPHPCPIKAALSAEIAEQVAQWEARNGKVKTLPLRVVEDKPAYNNARVRKIRVEDPL
jgi:hypothetical protein